MNHPDTQRALRVGDFAKAMEYTAKPGEILMEQCTRDMFELVKEIQFDCLVAVSMAMPITWMLSERYKIKLVYLGLVPEAPTSDFPFCVLSPVSLGDSSKDLASYSMVYNVAYQRTEEMVNRQRAELGLAKTTSPFDWLSLKEHFDMPTIYAFSKHVFGGKKPTLYRDNVEVAGFIELKLPTDCLSQKVVSFLEQPKTAPIFLGFGSMPALDPFQLFELTRDILEFNSNRRVILCCGWTNVEQVLNDLNNHTFEDVSTEDVERYRQLSLKLKEYIEGDRLLIIKEAPFHLLFPKCACIAHHCGAGTSGSAFKAGKPVVPIPVFMDQPFWAYRAYNMGIASKPIAFKDITSEQVNEAIAFVLEGEYSEDIKKKAQTLGEIMNKEEADPLSHIVELFAEKLEQEFIVPEYSCSVTKISFEKTGLKF